MRTLGITVGVLALIVVMGGGVASPSLAVAQVESAAPPTFTIDNLLAGDLTIQRSVSGSFSHRDVSTRIILTDDFNKTLAIADTSLLRGSTSNTAAMWAANSNFVDMSWAALPGAHGYAINKNGKALGVTSDTSFRDSMSRQVNTLTIVLRHSSKMTDRVEAFGGWLQLCPTN